VTFSVFGGTEKLEKLSGWSVISKRKLKGNINYFYISPPCVIEGST
jgi:hypothetical protein